MIYGEQHRAMMASIARFIAAEIEPHIDAWEEAEAFPAHDLFRKLGREGILGVTKPVELGGLGHISANGVQMAITVQTDMATPALARFGSDALKRDYLAPAIAGEVVTAIGVSEPGAGSDVASLKTRAVSDGDDYVITGTKMWITNALQADWICLLANTSDGRPHANKSLIVVPVREGGKRRPGIEMRKIKKLGNWSSDTAQVFFDGVRVPKSNRIGEEGKGFIYQMMQFQEERLSAAARRLAAMDLIDLTADYLRTREAFGRKLLDNQFIQFKLAELKTELESVRGLVHMATHAYVAGQDVLELASMAKLKAARVSREIADWCLQFQGGMGYTWDNRAARALRDFRLGSIGGGADEIMLTIIARQMGLDGRK